VGDLAGKLIEVCGSAATIVTDDARLRPEKSEVERLLASNALVHELTGWEPQVSLEEGLERTVEWMRDPANGARYKWDLYNV
jgi:nucleoside-diphosphate-sugar epimerase